MRFDAEVTALSAKMRSEKMTKTQVQDVKLPEAVMPSCPTRKLLKGQKALVTGAASGIGKSIAAALGQAGADVIVNYVTRSKGAQEVVDEVKKHGSKAIAFKADVSKEDQVKAMFQKMIEDFGTIDILVCNAGIHQFPVNI